MTGVQTCALPISVLLSGNLVSFLTLSLAYFMVYSLVIPVQQAMLANSKEEGGKVFGLFQVARSLGWIFGGLIGGFLYELLPTLPFIGATVIGFVSVLLIIKMKKSM